MNYTDAVAQLRQDNPDYDDEPPDIQVIIAREVGGILAEGYRNGVEFGTFDNCREYGLTVSAGGWTFCWYEHRNSDRINVEGCPDAEVQEWGPYGGADKFDTLFWTSYGQYAVAAKSLVAALERVKVGPATRHEVKVAMADAVNANEVAV